MLYGAKMAWRHLGSAPGQTALLVAGVAAAVFIFIFMSALIGGLAELLVNRTLGNQAHVTVAAPDRPLPLLVPAQGRHILAARQASTSPSLGLAAPLAWEATLAAFPGVRVIAPKLVGSGVLIRGEVTRPVTLTGLARDLGLSVGRAVTFRADNGNSVTLTVSGIYRLGLGQLDEAAAFVPVSAAQAVLERPGRVSAIELKLDDLYAAPAVAARIAAATGLDATPWTETSAQLFEALRAQGREADALVLDVADVAATAAAVAARGPFDVLVNSAGLARHAPALAVSPEDFDSVMGVNLRGAFFLTRAVAAGLIESGKPGSLINVSSQMGHVGGPDRAVYCASKHAVEGFTKAMAIEWGPAGVRVNTLCPTFVRTPLTQGAFDDPETRRWIAGKIKLGRPGEVEDLMGATLFLASDASALVTGTALMVDGGWTAE